MIFDGWGIFWLVVYLTVLVGLVILAQRNPGGKRVLNRNLSDWLNAADNKLSIPILIFTFSATLFSAFFMVGLPGFIYAHGMSTWAWVIFGDVVGMIGLYFVGMRFYRVMKIRGRVLSPLEIICPDAMSRFLFIALTTIFILPYLAVQIGGFGQLLETATDGAVSLFVASSAGLTAIYLYSLLGGIRAIAFSDFLQGALLLFCVIGLGSVIAIDAGGPIELLRAAQAQRPEMLAKPGPSGLMTSAYLFTGFAIFVALPLTQPQFLTRYLLVDEKSEAEASRHFRAIALGMGALIAVGGLFIIPIALGGFLNYSDLASGDQVLGITLREETYSWFGGLFTVGVLAAAMSTADSILFSLGHIFSIDVYKNVIAKDASEDHMKIVGRIFIFIVAIAALIIGVANSELIVTLSRISFEGTLLLLPTVLFGLWGQNRWKHAASMSIFVSAILYWLLRAPMMEWAPGLTAAIPAIAFGSLPFFVPARAQDPEGIS